MATKKASTSSVDPSAQSEIERRKDAKANATRQKGETPPENQDINEPYVNPKLA